MIFSLLSGTVTLWTIIGILIFLAALVVAITIHEFAHAWVADHLGDPTPRYHDRITLDPRAHLDPLGSVALLLVGFGWGKPVPFDPFNLKDPVKDSALIALAGPASNIILAAVISGAAALLHSVIGLPEIVLLATLAAVQVNVMLAIFNMIPVYPLDGSKIAMALLPRNFAIDYDQFMSQYGTLILIMLIIPIANGNSLAGQIISPVINLITGLLFQIW